MLGVRGCRKVIACARGLVARAAKAAIGCQSCGWGRTCRPTDVAGQLAVQVGRRKALSSLGRPVVQCHGNNAGSRPGAGSCPHVYRALPAGSIWVADGSGVPRHVCLQGLGLALGLTIDAKVLRTAWRRAVRGAVGRKRVYEVVVACVPQLISSAEMMQGA